MGITKTFLKYPRSSNRHVFDAAHNVGKSAQESGSSVFGLGIHCVVFVVPLSAYNSYLIEDAAAVRAMS